MTEQDVRLDIFDTLLTTPHGDLNAIFPVHEAMCRKDPIFYVHLAAWYFDQGDVRDHKEMFIARLVSSRFEGHRNVGLALLRRLPPYEVARVLDFVRGTIHGRPATTGSRAEEPQAGSGIGFTGLMRGLFGRGNDRFAEGRERERCGPVRSGLFMSPPRSMRTEIARYLREREANPMWFDECVLQARISLKRMYAVLHVKPCERAQKILFENDPPRDSKLFALKRIGRARTPADQARVIVEHRIPYRVAASVIGEMAPSVLAALIDVMTPQEVINNMGSLKRRGVFGNADLKQHVEQKLTAAKSHRRVAAYKAKTAIETSGVGGDLAEKLDAVTDAQVKARGEIKRPTALLIDKSASMDAAIEVGKRIGAMISSICTADLVVYAFDTLAYPIAVQGGELAAWEAALRGISSSGCTSCGVALEWMRRKKQYVEQILMITDEGENSAPTFADALARYQTELKVRPNVCIVRIGRYTNTIEKTCRAAAVECGTFVFKGDYYALPNLIPMLTRPSRIDLLMEIMEYPLPQRKAV